MTEDCQISATESNNFTAIFPNTSNTEDITASITIARNVVKACEDDAKQKQIDDLECSKRVMFYTNADETLLSHIETSTNDLRSSVTFRNIAQRLCQILSISDKFNQILHNIIKDSYIKLHMLPTKNNISLILKETNYKQLIPTLGAVLESEQTNMFKWKKLPKTKSVILVENPEQLYKRNRYLRMIKYYREQQRCFVYILRNKVENYIIMSYVYFAVSPGYGILNYLQAYDDKQETMIKFVKDSLVSMQPCVVVVPDSWDNEAVDVTAGSSKSEMIKWLERHNIPHDHSCHKAELFLTIEKYKLTVNSATKLGNLVASLGHQLLMCPAHVHELDFFNNIQKANFADKKATDITLKEWLDLELMLVSNEAVVYQTDLMYESVLEKIFTRAEHEKINDDETCSCDKNIFDSEYIANIIQF